ncbi:MAG: hypothetical protein HZA91_11930 [Verrucomicrobia bacterium]|nr:hypothetical protein [Verrucomicrobiota bacterium]
MLHAEPAPIPGEIFPVEKIRPGLKGKVYTVMQGTEVVPIEAELYGVLRDFIGPKVHLIVGKLVDERTKLTGAVHGMSGSPLYIEGKIAGALSYRLTQFEKEGWCGFTPIDDMIAADGAPTPPRKPTPLASSRRAEPQLALASTRDFTLTGGVPTGFRPLAVPVAFAGVHPRVFEWLSGEFARFNRDGLMLPTLGGGGQEDKPLDGVFEPGAPVAGVLSSGDLHAAATGTLTWRKGKKVLGFGHPFSQTGSLALPMARAEIIATVSSYMYPHKLSNTRQIVGTITQDRLTAIAGEVGPVPPMAEMTVRLHCARADRTFRSRLFQHQDMTPAIAASCIGNAMQNTLEYSREFSMRLTGDIETQRHGKVHIEDFYSGEARDHAAPMQEFSALLAELLDNRFETPQLMRINVDVRMDEEQRTFDVGDVVADRDRAKPGETVTLRATLKPWRGKPRIETLTFTVPDDVRAGELDILVGNAAAADALDGRRGAERQERAQNLDQVVRLLNQRRPKDALYLRVTRKADGIVLGDQRMTALPPSAMMLYDSNRTALEGTRLTTAAVMEKRVPMNAVVTGSRTLKIKVE